MARGLDHGKLAEWQQRMATFRSSGLTAAAFCRQQGIAPAKFYYWARRVRSASIDAQPPRSEKPRASSNADGRSDPPAIDVFIGSQVRVRLPASQPQLVAAIVSSITANSVDRLVPSAFQRIDLIDSAADRR